MIAFPKSFILLLFISRFVFYPKRIDSIPKDIEKTTAIKISLPDVNVTFCFDLWCKLTSN